MRSDSNKLKELDSDVKLNYSVLPGARYGLCNLMSIDLFPFSVRKNGQYNSQYKQKRANAPYDIQTCLRLPNHVFRKWAVKLFIPLIIGFTRFPVKLYLRQTFFVEIFIWIVGIKMENNLCLAALNVCFSLNLIHIISYCVAVVCVWLDLDYSTCAQKV